jgi:hypothetical protein
MKDHRQSHPQTKPYQPFSCIRLHTLNRTIPRFPLKLRFDKKSDKETGSLYRVSCILYPNINPVGRSQKHAIHNREKTINTLKLNKVFLL